MTIFSSTRSRLRRTLRTGCALIAILLIASAGASQEQSEAPSDERRERVRTRTVIKQDPGDGTRWVFRSDDDSEPVALRPRIQLGGYLGVGLVDVTPELVEFFGAPGSAGVLVSSVEDGSPAAAAGVAVGDLVIAIDGEPMLSSRQLAQSVRSRKEGTTVSLDVYRDSRPESLSATLVVRERPQIDVANVFFRCPEGEECDDEVASYITRFREMIPLDPGVINEQMGELLQRMEQPEWKERVLELRSGSEGLAGRLEKLEARIRELERQLEEKQD